MTVCVVCVRACVRVCVRACGQMLRHFGPSLSAKPGVDKWHNYQPLHPTGYAHYKKKLAAWWQLTERRLGVLLVLARVRSVDLSCARSPSIHPSLPPSLPLPLPTPS